jgi:16S rRNA (adenine1518-N6/adenine1519-N6)-dimethyltransferase
MRRKTLQNAISAKLPAYSKEKITEAIAAIGKDEKVRGERLSTEDFANLANYLSEN